MLIKTVLFQAFATNFQANSTSIPLLVRERAFCYTRILSPYNFSSINSFALSTFELSNEARYIRVVCSES